jgi:hypothetical protein
MTPIKAMTPNKRFQPKPAPCAGSAEPRRWGSMKALLLIVAIATPASVHAFDRPSCAKEIGEQLPTDDPGLGWHFPTLHPGTVFAMGVGGLRFPYATEGDFDGDGKMDIAYLIETDTAKKRFVAVCLSGGAKVHLLPAGNCVGNIATRAKAKWKYKYDAIDVSCGDFGGARHELNAGRFELIEDPIDPDMP